MEAAGPSKMLEPICETTWGYIPEDHNLDTNHHENLKSPYKYERVLYSECNSM